MKVCPYLEDAVEETCVSQIPQTWYFLTVHLSSLALCIMLQIRVQNSVVRDNNAAIFDGFCMPKEATMCDTMVPEKWFKDLDTASPTLDAGNPITGLRSAMFLSAIGERCLCHCLCLTWQPPTCLFDMCIGMHRQSWAQI